MEVGRSVIGPGSLESLDDTFEERGAEGDDAGVGSEAIEPGEGVVKRCRGVFGLGRGRECARLELEAAFLRESCHPVEGDVGERESTGIGIVAAAHVAMDAGEPDLHESLAGRGRGGPKGGLKLESLLVDGQRLHGVEDVGVEAGVEKAVMTDIDSAEDGGNAERADRIPDAKQLDAGGVHLVGLVRGLSRSTGRCATLR